jgi:dihydroflavonol-4-reductase
MSNHSPFGGHIMKAFVTGSTGLLGSNLVQLLLAQGYEVKALARSKQKAAQILGKNTKAQIILGDMEDVGGFASELADVDVLFHVAAYFREYYGPGDHWGKLKQINVDGTIQILTEAEKRGVKQTIYVSSSAVIGVNPNGTPADESIPAEDEYLQENLYAKSKVVAEAAIDDWLKIHKMPVVLILPTVILGPNDAAPTTMGNVIVNFMNRKLPAVPPGGMEFVDARDVAQAMINAVECGKSGERYIVSQGYHTMRDLAQTLEKVAGVPAPRNVPFPVMLIFVWIGERLATLRGKPVEISVSALRLLRRRREVTARKAEQQLNIRFRSFEDTLRDESAWYKANGYMNG